MTRRLFGGALLSATACVRAAETSSVRGKRLLDDCIAALGGNTFLRMKDRKETGRAYTFYREELTGLSVSHIYTRYTNPEPGKLGLLERQAYGKRQESAVLFLDGQGFEITFRGARPLPDQLIERYFTTTRHNIFYFLRQRLHEPDLVFQHTGSTVLENQPVDILEVFDGENENITVYLNSATKLPVRQRFFRRDSVNRGDRVEEVTRFSNYQQAAGGILWPLNLQRERDTEKMAEIYDQSVTIDAGVPDELFRLPNGIEVLKKPNA